MIRLYRNKIYQIDKKNLYILVKNKIRDVDITKFEMYYVVISKGGS